MEALARWVDPARGIISPGEILPVLKKYHLIHKMDLYIFEQVCREVRIRYEAGIKLCPLSVYFSRQDFDHIDVAHELDHIVSRYDIAKYGIDKSYFIPFSSGGSCVVIPWLSQMSEHDKMKYQFD